jgi:hypothetical protein
MKNSVFEKGLVLGHRWRKSQRCIYSQEPYLRPILEILPFAGTGTEDSLADRVLLCHHEL